MNNFSHLKEEADDYCYHYDVGDSYATEAIDLSVPHALIGVYQYWFDIDNDERDCFVWRLFHHSQQIDELITKGKPYADFIDQTFTVEYSTYGDNSKVLIVPVYFNLIPFTYKCILSNKVIPNNKLPNY